MKKFDYETLKHIVKTKKGKEYTAEAERVYSEKHAGKPIAALPFRSYEKYFKDGDRKAYEQPYFERRNRLYLLQILAIAQPKKYIEELEDVLAAICDEYSWVLPAHVPVPVDLFCAETGALLAETVYIFKDKLSPHLLERIEKTIERQVFVVYETKKSWWESGNTNNWGAVCACGVGLTYMYMSSERFEQVKNRLFDTFKCYIEHGLDDDGYCSEGVGYWQYGFGKLCEFFDDYVRLYGERPEFIDSPKIQKTLAYANNTRMEKDVYLPFADGGYRHLQLGLQPCVAIKSLYGKAFVLPPCKLGLDGNYSSGGLPLLFNLNISQNTIDNRKESSVYYKNAQVFIRKRKNYAFAAKCGNNDEFHNHNDVGSFQIVKDGLRYICDVGCGEYTKDYFSSKRYEYFVCSANAHSIPIVDGTIQREGKQYCGEVVSRDENKIVMDISSAYPNFGGQLLVTYETRENAVEAHYLCKGLSSGVTFRFLSDIKPKKKKDGLYVADMKIVCKQGLEPLLSVEKYSAHLHSDGKKAEAYIIEYKAEKSGDTEADFIFEL